MSDSSAVRHSANVSRSGERRAERCRRNELERRAARPDNVRSCCRLLSPHFVCCSPLLRSSFRTTRTATVPTIRTSAKHLLCTRHRSSSSSRRCAKSAEKAANACATSTFAVSAVLQQYTSGTRIAFDTRVYCTLYCVVSARLTIDCFVTWNFVLLVPTATERCGSFYCGDQMQKDSERELPNAFQVLECVRSGDRSRTRVRAVAVCHRCIHPER